MTCRLPWSKHTHVCMAWSEVCVCVHVVLSAHYSLRPDVWPVLQVGRVMAEGGRLRREEQL